MTIDPRIVDYDHVNSPQLLLEQLEKDRFGVSLRAAPATAPSEVDRTPTRARAWVSAGVVLFVLGAAANLVGVLSAPSYFVGGALAVAGYLGWHAWRTNGELDIPTALMAVLLGVAAGAGVAFVTRDREQIVVIDAEPAKQSVIDEATKAGRKLAWQAEGALAGPGTRSWAIVLRDDRVVYPPRGDLPVDEDGQIVIPQSDEVRIYDITEQGLEFRLDFLPQGQGQIAQFPTGDSPNFHFVAQPPVDVDGDNTAELIGAFERQSLASGPLPVPVLISRDPARSGYRIGGMVREAPKLAWKDRGFTEPTQIKDRIGETTLRAYAVDAFAVLPDRGEAVFVAAYRDPRASPSGGTRYEFKVASMNLQRGQLEVVECSADHGRPHSYVLVEGDTPVRDVLEREIPARIDAPCRLAGTSQFAGP